VVPLVTIATLWGLHALPAFFRCAVSHNVAPGLGPGESGLGRGVALALSLAILFLAGNRLLRSGSGSSTRLRQVVVFVTAMVYLVRLEGPWPLVTSQDFLPLTPLLALLAAACVEWAIGRTGGWRVSLVPSRAWATLATIVVALELLAVNRAEAAWQDRSIGGRDFLAEVLKDTRRGEYVMDLKGETVFRPRPCYHVLEAVTRRRLELGLLRDTIADDVVRTHTHFAVTDNSA